MPFTRGTYEDLLVETTEPGGADLTLLLVPAAGAGPRFYGPWSELMPGGFRQVVLRLPGRDELWDAPLMTDADEIAEVVAHQLKSIAPEGDVIVVGSCTGGLLAYHIARRLIAGGRPPLGLVVQGTTTPPVAGLEPLAHRSSSAELRAYFEQGETEDFDDEVWQMAEPRIRSDLQAVETCEYDLTPMPVPITAVRGELDTQVSAGETERWAAYTTGEFRVAEIDGGHFVMLVSADEWADEVVAAARRWRDAR